MINLDTSHKAWANDDSIPLWLLGIGAQQLRALLLLCMTIPATHYMSVTVIVNFFLGKKSSLNHKWKKLCNLKTK